MPGHTHQFKEKEREEALPLARPPDRKRRRPKATETDWEVLSELKLHMAQRTHFCYADLIILMERGTLTDELPPLCCHNNQEKNEENEAWLHNVLLPSV
jgi:hypothetical protein